MAYFAVPVLRVGWNDSPNPSIEPGPLGTEMVFGETPLLSAAKIEFAQKKTKKTKNVKGLKR